MSTPIDNSMSTPIDNSMSTPIDCRSSEGVTISLLESIMAIAKVITERGLTHPQIREALLDMKSNESLEKLLNQ